MMSQTMIFRFSRFQWGILWPELWRGGFLFSTDRLHFCCLFIKFSKWLYNWHNKYLFSTFKASTNKRGFPYKKVHLLTHSRDVAWLKLLRSCKNVFLFKFKLKTFNRSIVLSHKPHFLKSRKKPCFIKSRH